MRAGRYVAAAALGTLLAGTAACGDDDPGDPIQGEVNPDGDGSTTEGSQGPTPPLADVDLTLTKIGDFDQPISIVSRVDDPALYVAGWSGTVTKVEVEGEGADREYTPESEPLLDIDEQVITGGERGLLDIAISPDGDRLYVSYSAEPDGTSTVASYAFDGGTVDESTRKEVLTVEDFAENHNGGDITFGPDGYLYVAMGDGGGGGDPEENGQDTDALLGKILRIDPEGATGDEPYAIPPDNPFADGQGGKPEIWLYGVRNPWRFSFDAATKDLWIGDVGQGSWEEIDWLPASEGGGRGANLGWNEMEGSHPFEGGENPEGATLPVYEYETHDDSGCAITGGLVYRGPATDLEGAYLFGDSCQNKVRAIRLVDGKVVDEALYDDAIVGQLVSFGTDNGGDVYAVGLGGEVFRIGA